MKEQNLEKYLSGGDCSVAEAMAQIDRNAKGIVFVADEEKHLLGSVTDGDIRRWLIRTGNLAAKISQAMNPRPRYLLNGNTQKAAEYMKENVIGAVPVLDADRRIIDIIFGTDGFLRKQKKRNTLAGTPVIIMAGGKGARLYPYTKILPKPLIPIGDIPIIERIMDRFCTYGTDEFYLTVNYKKGMIKSYFAETSPPYRIRYVEEDKPLGTAGSIRLIEDKFTSPVFVTNCDILIEADYGDILDYHRRSGNQMTIVSALKNIVVPYGVLHSQGEGIVTSMEEKPSLSYFVNAGMYILNPDLLKRIPEDTFFHMTDLVKLLMEEKQQVGMYPISEDSFLDMGKFEELFRMEGKLERREGRYTNAFQGKDG